MLEGTAEKLATELRWLTHFTASQFTTKRRKPAERRDMSCKIKNGKIVGKQREELPGLVFVFERNRAAEVECGYLLAGHLIVDFPKGTLEEETKPIVTGIIKHLCEMHAAGNLKDLATGWVKGTMPEGDEDHEALQRWVKGRLVIGVRLAAPEHGDRFPMDKEMLLAAGIVKEH